MAFIYQELAQVPGCHVGWDLHHFANAVFTEDLHDLQEKKENNQTRSKHGWRNIKKYSQAEQAVLCCPPPRRDLNIGVCSFQDEGFSGAGAPPELFGWGGHVGAIEKHGVAHQNQKS